MGLVSSLLRSSFTLSSFPLKAATRRAVLAASASVWGNREWPTKLVVRDWNTRRLRLSPGPGLPDLWPHEVTRGRGLSGLSGLARQESRAGAWLGSASGSAGNKQEPGRVTEDREPPEDERLEDMLGIIVMLSLPMLSSKTFPGDVSV